MTDPQATALLDAARRLVAALARAHRGYQPHPNDRAYYEALAALEAAIKKATTPTKEQRP